jgi:hypothetical protein
MSPAKIAIAVAVTIAAMAGIGAMKNVIGTRSAVAIVAVRPGHRADEKAEQRRRQHHDDVVRVQDHRKRLCPGGASSRRNRDRRALPDETIEQSPGQRNLESL